MFVELHTSLVHSTSQKDNFEGRQALTVGSQTKHGVIAEFAAV